MVLHRSETCLHQHGCSILIVNDSGAKFQHGSNWQLVRNGTEGEGCVGMDRYLATYEGFLCQLKTPACSAQFKGNHLQSLTSTRTRHRTFQRDCKILYSVQCWMVLEMIALWSTNKPLVVGVT